MTDHACELLLPPRPTSRRRTHPQLQQPRRVLRQRAPLARRYGVKPETIDGWREEAVGAIDEALRRGTGKGARELELERENSILKDALTRQTMKSELLERALEGRTPTLPGRPRR